MRHRQSGAITHTGDECHTELSTGFRVGKSSPPIETLGAIEELNSWIGVLLALYISPTAKQVLKQVQQDLFDLAAQVSAPGTPLLSPAYLAPIEESYERMSGDLGTSEELHLPGGVLSACFGHVARAVCRRAERQLVSLGDLNGRVEATEPKESASAKNWGVCYLNRLSDLLFVASCLENRSRSRTDT
jgi:cob(I)alamin adenosyltransferase